MTTATPGLGRDLDWRWLCCDANWFNGQLAYPSIFEGLGELVIIFLGGPSGDPIFCLMEEQILGIPSEQDTRITGGSDSGLPGCGSDPGCTGWHRSAIDLCGG